MASNRPDGTAYRARCVCGWEREYGEGSPWNADAETRAERGLSGHVGQSGCEWGGAEIVPERLVAEGPGADECPECGAPGVEQPADGQYECYRCWITFDAEGVADGE